MISRLLVYLIWLIIVVDDVISSFICLGFFFFLVLESIIDYVVDKWWIVIGGFGDEIIIVLKYRCVRVCCCNWIYGCVGFELVLKWFSECKWFVGKNVVEVGRKCCVYCCYDGF